MENTRNTRATRGERTVVTTATDMPFTKGRQIIQNVRDIFTCTDGTQVVRETEWIRMLVRREGELVPHFEYTVITWRTMDGRRGFDGTMAQACQMQRRANQKG